MRFCLITALLCLLVCQAKGACVEDLLRLFTHDVSETEKQMNVTITDISKKIEKTRNAVESIISNTKSEIQAERFVLEDLEDTAYGESLVQKKSIADCLQQDRVRMKFINTTESVIYSVCRADLSLLLVKLNAVSVERVSAKMERDLKVCVEDDAENCEKEVDCVTETLKEANDQLDVINAKVEKKLEEIESTSMICADGKKSVVISMIKEQENNFKYCVEKILNGV